MPTKQSCSVSQAAHRARSSGLIFVVLLVLMLVVPVTVPDVRITSTAAAQAVWPPVLTGKLTYTFSSRFESDHSSEDVYDQAVVQVRLRWNEERQSYEDSGSTYTYSGTYKSRQFNPDDIVGMIGEGSKQGDGRLDGSKGYIGASVEADEGQPRKLLLSISNLQYRSSGTITYYPSGEQQTVTGEGTLGLLCDDVNWLIGKEQADQPGVFSFACSLTQGSDKGSSQTTVSGFLSTPAPRPRIADLRFEQQDVETQQWERIDGPPGTVDGNQVRVIASVENLAGVPYNLPLRFMDGETHQVLPDGAETASLPPGALVEMTYLWDTDGWAWDAAAPPANLPKAHPNRAVEVRLGSDAVLYDVWNAPIIVRPKPVLAVHGLNSNAAGWSKYPGFLRQVNDYWAGFAVPGMQTGDDIIAQQASSTLLNNARTMHNYVQQIRKQENAWHIDIVAHSMGGLISRQYIHSFMPADAPDGRPVAKHLVMLGTPNRGSECATIQLYLAQTYHLPNVIAPLELMPEVVAFFNARVTNSKGTKFSVLAGNPYNTFICNPQANGPNDMVVTVPSAHHTYSDTGLTAGNHIQMTGSQADFANWVLPHLAVGRTATVKSAGTSSLAAQPAAGDTPQAPIQFAQTVNQTIAAGGSLEIPLTLSQASNVSIALIAEPGVSAVLRDGTGTQIATSAASDAAAAAHLRGFTVPKPVAGTYTLQLTSKEPRATSLLVAVTIAGSNLEADVRASRPDKEGRITLTAALKRNGVVQPGATVRATLIGSEGNSQSVGFADDGQHGDGAANDGVFGAFLKSTDVVPLTAVVRMQANSEERSVVVVAAPAMSTRVFLPVIVR